MQLYLEYAASSSISVKQQNSGRLVQYSGMLPSYSKDVFIGGGEKLRRQTDCLCFPCINTAECTEQTRVSASTFESSIEPTLGLQAVL